MLRQLILKIAPAQIDQQMLWMTEVCLLVLLAVFLIFGMWIFVRIFARYLEIVFRRFKAKMILKKSNDLRAARNTLKAKLFKNVRWAKDSFEEFHLAWEEARPQGEEKAILPIRLREFLTPEIVLDGARNRRIAEALPGIFVGLGIFGTFLGLVLGLRELEFGKLESLQAGVGHLISGLSLAFLTSLGGIALSITFSLLYRFAISRLERSFLSLDDLLCRAYPYEPQERYARRLYDMQADIKQGLQTLATDVATQISGAIGSQLGKAIENHLVPVMKEMHGWIEKHIETSRQQQESLAGGFNEHLTRLSKVISEHFENSQDRQTEAMEAVLKHYSVTLTETFQSQFQSMEQIISDTTEAQKEIKQQLIAFSEQLQMQFQSQGQLIEKTNRAGEILSQSLEGLESIAQKLQSAVNDISSAAELLESSAIVAKEGQEILKDTMERQINTMAHTREELEATWQSITDNAGNLVNQIRQAVQDLTTVVGENLVQALESFDGKVAEVVERFSGTLFETNQTIADIPSLVLNMNETIVTIKDAISEQRDVVNGMKETSEQVISENVKIAVDATQRLGESTSQIASSTDGMRGFLEGMSESLEKTASEFSETNESAMVELKRMMNELVVEFQQMQSMFGQNGPLSQALRRFEGYNPGNPEHSDWNRLTQLLKEPLDSLNQRLADLKESVSVLSGNGLGEESSVPLFDRLSGIDQRIEVLSKLNKAIVIKLDALSQYATKVVAEIDRTHEPNRDSTSTDSRWWRFGRSTKK